MTAYTSTQTGLFSANSTWTPNTGHPSVNADTFTISSGHIVTLDSDTSGLTSGFGASVINGTLQAQRSAGTYILKMNGNLSGTGIIDASDGAGGVYASGQVAEIRFAGNFANSMSGVQNLICVEPTNKFAILTQAEISTATTLHIDRNLTGEATYWKAGDLVRVCNINAASQSEQYIIQSVTSNTIVLTSGLTNSKLIGSYVVLVSRNVKVTGTGAGVGTGFSSHAQASIIKAEVRGLSSGIGSTGATGVGGCISNCTTGYSGQRTHPLFSAVVCGCTTGISGARGVTITPSALIACCGSAFVSNIGLSILCDVIGCINSIANSFGGTVVGSRFIGCNTVISTSSGVTLMNVITTGCNVDIDTCEFISFINCNLTSPTSFNNALLSSRAVNGYVSSIDDGQVPGAFKAWPFGGTVTSVSSPVYDSSRVRSYLHASTGNNTFMQRTIIIPAGGSVYIRCYVQKDTSMAYLPRLWVFSADKEPILSGSPDVEVIMTDSLNTWEILEATLTNTTSSDKPYMVRTLANNATGSVYFDPIIRLSAMNYPVGMEAGMVA